MLINEIKKYLSLFEGSLEEKDGLYVFSYSVGEIKTSVNQRALSYTAKFRILKDKKTVRFSEIVKESSVGLGVGGEIPMGIGYKSENYITGSGGRSGAVTEKSRLGNKEMEYRVNYKEIRQQIKLIVERQGYTFRYKIFPWGL